MQDTIARYFFPGALEATSAEEMERDLEFANVTSGARPTLRASRCSSRMLNIITPVINSRFGEEPGSNEP